MKNRSTLIILTALSVQLLLGVLSYIAYGRSCSTVIPLVLRILIMVPLLIPPVIAYRDRKSAFPIFIIAALVLSGAGDLFFTVGMFIGGAGCVLVAHALNAGNFMRKFYSLGICLRWKEMLSGFVVFTAGYVLFTMVFSRTLFSDKGMYAVVLVYAIVLSYALWKAFLLYKTGNFSFWLAVFIGELLFYITDMQAAYSGLILHCPTYEWINNIIYYTGLYLLSISTLLEEELP